MLYVKVTYRQRSPDGRDKPKADCETTRNGPFTRRDAAEHFAASVANTTAIFEAVIEGTVDGD